MFNKSAKRAVAEFIGLTTLLLIIGIFALEASGDNQSSQVVPTLWTRDEPASDLRCWGSDRILLTICWIFEVGAEVAA